MNEQENISMQDNDECNIGVELNGSVCPNGSIDLNNLVADKNVFDMLVDRASCTLMSVKYKR